MRVFWVYILWCSMGVTAWAQSGPAIGNERFRHLTVHDGLSQSAIEDIHQDQVGFVWFATRDGLNRYDGQSFEVFRRTRGDSTTLNHNTCHVLAEDSLGNIWVGTDFGLARYSYQSGQFTRFIPQTLQPQAARNRIYSLIALGGTRFLVGTGGGALLFSPATGFSEPLAETQNQYISSLLLRENGDVWIGNPSTLHQYDAKLNWQRTFTQAQTPFGIQTNRILCLFEDRLERLWVGTSHGLFQFLEVESTFHPTFQNGNEGLWVEDIVEDETGAFWIAAGRLYVLWDGKVEKVFEHTPSRPGSLSQNIATALELTKEGMLWVGTNGYGINGLNLNGYPIYALGYHHDADFSLSAPYVSAIQTTTDGRLLVGTDQSLDVLDLTAERRDQTLQIHRQGSTVTHGINVIVPDPKRSGTYWLGTGGGIARYSLPHGRATLLPGQNNQARVNDIKILPNQKLLVAHDRGLQTYDPTTDTWQNLRMYTPDSTSPGEPTCLALWDSLAWVGTRLGAYLINWHTGEQVARYVHDPLNPHSLPGNYIKNFIQSRTGQWYITTWGGGLARLRPETDDFEIFDHSDGLPNNVVYGILEDGRGFLWMSTNGGLARFNPRSGNFARFTEQDGLQSQEFNTGAFHQGPDGTLYFGGINGLNWFHPDQIEIRHEAPHTLITDLFVDHQKVGPGPILDKHILITDSLALNWDQNNFSFQVTGLSFLSKQPLEYRYRLQGFEDEWNYLGTVDFINFTSLPPGSYLLEVQAGLSNQTWDQPGKSLYIYIRPPFWQELWFQISAVVTFIIVVVLIAFGRNRALRTKNRNLEEMVLERTRTIKEQSFELEANQEELAQQNEVLKLTSEDLARQNQKLTDQQQKLTELTENLEASVAERTVDLMRANQELAEQNSQLEQFAFITAHNLKAPISQFQGLLSILPPMHTFDDYSREVISRMQGSADDLREVVDDLNLILDVKRGVGREFVAVDLIEHLNKVVGSLRSEAEKKKVVIHLPTIKEVRIMGFPPYVHSILHNLIHNAIKYSSSDRPSWIRVRISIEGDLVSLEVEDNGIGIDTEMAGQKLFRLYQRFNTTHPGKGFGLFLVKTQIEAMGGTVALNSTVGEGTTIFVHFIRMPQLQG